MALQTVIFSTRGSSNDAYGSPFYSNANSLVNCSLFLFLKKLPNMTKIYRIQHNCFINNFTMTKASNFTESEYNQFVNALTTKLGNGTDASEENVNKKTTWKVNGLFWSVEWDLADGIAINFS